MEISISSLLSSKSWAFAIDEIRGSRVRSAALTSLLLVDTVVSNLCSVFLLAPLPKHGTELLYYAGTGVMLTQSSLASSSHVSIAKHYHVMITLICGFAIITCALGPLLATFQLETQSSSTKAPS